MILGTLVVSDLVVNKDERDKASHTQAFQFLASLGLSKSDLAPELKQRLDALKPGAAKAEDAKKKKRKEKEVEPNADETVSKRRKKNDNKKRKTH